MISGGGYNIRVAPFVNDPAPTSLLMSRSVEGSVEDHPTSPGVFQPQRICSPGSVYSSGLSTGYYRNQNKWSMQTCGTRNRRQCYAGCRGLRRFRVTIARGRPGPTLAGQWSRSCDSGVHCATNYCSFSLLPPRRAQEMPASALFGKRQLGCGGGSI